jgi:hypothetical protein
MTDASAEARRDLLDAVGEDSALTPEEKETTLRLGRRDDHVTGYTAEAGLARRLLAHPHVAVEGVTVPDGDARRDVPPEEHTPGDAIVGVRVRAPVGLLVIKSTPRRDSAGHADVVSPRVLQEGEP